jgi:hypothetical protein
MPSNFKKLVRARMAETGESWQAAQRWVRSQETRPEMKPKRRTDEEIVVDIGVRNCIGDPE